MKILFNPDYCVGCHSCEVACKQLHGLPVGVFRIKVNRREVLIANGKPKIEFDITICRQCDDAPCIVACPQKALERNDKGVVVVNRDMCNGCKLCIDACPHHALWFNPETNIIEKCDLCIGRGLEVPFCVKHCMSGALQFKH